MKKNLIYGFSLIEAAIILAIIGLVIGGIWIAASAVSDNQKISDTLSGLALTCDRAKNTFPRSTARAIDGSDDNGVFDITAASIVAGVLPANWVSNGIIIPPIANNMAVYQIATNSTHTEDIRGVPAYHLNFVPNKYCRRLVMSMTANPQLFFWIVVGTGTTGVNAWTANVLYTPPYSDPMSWCGSGDSNGYNKIAFVCGY